MPKKDTAATKAVKKNKGLLGRAARGLSGRQSRIDRAVSAASGWGTSAKDVRRK